MSCYENDLLWMGPILKPVCTINGVKITRLRINYLVPITFSWQARYTNLEKFQSCAEFRIFKQSLQCSFFSVKDANINYNVLTTWQPNKQMKNWVIQFYSRTRLPAVHVVCINPWIACYKGRASLYLPFRI